MSSLAVNQALRYGRFDSFCSHVKNDIRIIHTAQVNFESEVAYWNILKVAHSSIQHFLNAYGYSMVTSPEQVPKDLWNFSVVRHPVGRYWSSVHVMWSQYDKPQPADRYLKRVLKSNRKGNLFTHNEDQHFADQVKFLPTDRDIQLFPIQRVGDIPKMLGLDWEMPHIRKMRPEFKEALADHVRPSDEEFLCSQYDDDLELYNSTLS